jgi:hypothetical protein
MIAPSHEPTPLSALRAFGRALACNPNDALIGFLQPATDQPLVLRDGRFAGAILYAMTRTNRAIATVTFQLVGSTNGQGVAALRDDGDWEIPPLIFSPGTSTIIATASTTDGLSAHAHISVSVSAGA